MTIKEAYQILGLPPEATLSEIKKKYRKLMMQVHPDAGIAAKDAPAYHAHELNTAYAILKKKSFSSALSDAQKPHAHGEKKSANICWNAPINPTAYREREILQYVEEYDGTVLGNFCVARGKYLWTLEEEFPLFLLSIYRCSKQLLDELDESLPHTPTPATRQQVQQELTYLLAQQFIMGSAFLKEFARKETPAPDGTPVFYLSSMLELSEKIAPLRQGERLSPSGVRQHRLYLKNQAEQEIGYLSFADDRLYYIVIPLFEQKAVQIKIQIGDTPPEKRRSKAAACQSLHVWLKLQKQAASRLPENLNLQITQLLETYK